MADGRPACVGGLIGKLNILLKKKNVCIVRKD